MKHLTAGDPCPMDATPTTRSNCSKCPHFISYRGWIGVNGRDNVATIGCNYGADVDGWLRREFAAPTTPAQRPTLGYLAIGLVGGLLAAALFDRKENR